MKIVLLSALCTAVASSAASAQTTLRYKFKDGEKLEYVMEQKMKMTMSINNMDIETKMNMSMDMSWNVVGVNSDGSAKLQMKVTRAKMSMDGPTGQVEVDSNAKNEPDDAIGKIFSQIIKATATMEMTGTMQTNGDMKDIKVSEETVKAMKNLPGADKLGDMLSPESFKSMVSNLVFPTDAVTKGKTWTNKNEAKTPIGKTITEGTYTYEGPVQKDGATLEKISIKPNIKIEPDPKAPVKIELKESKGSGQILFDNKAGRMVESTTNQVMQMQLGIAGMNINQTVDQTATMRLKK
jgi:hypothetical protein